ncbi:hypothetical protein Hanom_Chr12g01119081 [Helianthus anomalus]
MTVWSFRCTDNVQANGVPNIVRNDNMDVSKSHIEFVNDSVFFKKMKPYKVKDIFSKYLKSVNYPKCGECEEVIPKRLDVEWATVGNTADCGMFAMRHVETWFGETTLKWDTTWRIGLMFKMFHAYNCSNDYVFFIWFGSFFIEGNWMFRLFVLF